MALLKKSLMKDLYVKGGCKIVSFGTIKNKNSNLISQKLARTKSGKGHGKKVQYEVLDFLFGSVASLLA
jgi:hypothetical protein